MTTAGMAIAASMPNECADDTTRPIEMAAAQARKNRSIRLKSKERAEGNNEPQSQVPVRSSGCRNCGGYKTRPPTPCQLPQYSDRKASAPAADLSYLPPAAPY